MCLSHPPYGRVSRDYCRLPSTRHFLPEPATGGLEVHVGPAITDYQIPCISILPKQIGNTLQYLVHVRRRSTGLSSNCRQEVLAKGQTFLDLLLFAGLSQVVGPGFELGTTTARSVFFDCVHDNVSPTINQGNISFIVHNGCLGVSTARSRRSPGSSTSRTTVSGSSCMEAWETSPYPGVGSKDHDRRTDQNVQHGDPEGEPL
jgi:hypothetical protein